MEVSLWFSLRASFPVGKCSEVFVLVMVLVLCGESLGEVGLFSLGWETLRFLLGRVYSEKLLDCRVGNT